MALPIEASSICRTFTAVADCCVNVVGHVWSVVFTFHSVTYATLAGVSRQLWIKCQVGETLSDRAWYHCLYGAIEGGSTNQNALKVV